MFENFRYSDPWNSWVIGLFWALPERRAAPPTVRNRNLAESVIPEALLDKASWRSTCTAGHFRLCLRCSSTLPYAVENLPNQAAGGVSPHRAI